MLVLWWPCVSSVADAVCLLDFYSNSAAIHVTVIAPHEVMRYLQVMLYCCWGCYSMPPLHAREVK